MTGVVGVSFGADTVALGQNGVELGAGIGAGSLGSLRAGFDGDDELLYSSVGLRGVDGAVGNALGVGSGDAGQLTDGSGRTGSAKLYNSIRQNLSAASAEMGMGGVFIDDGMDAAASIDGLRFSTPITFGRSGVGCHLLPTNAFHVQAFLDSWH